MAISVPRQQSASRGRERNPDPMRITNSIIVKQSLANIQAGTRGMAKAQAELSSGLRVQRVSEDPSAAASVLRLDGSLRAMDQYRRNLTSASARLTAEEGVLGEVGGRYNLLEGTRANFDSLELGMRTAKAELQEADMERVMIELVTRQTSFQSALLATSRIMGLNLADYLR